MKSLSLQRDLCLLVLIAQSLALEVRETASGLNATITRGPTSSHNNEEGSNSKVIVQTPETGWENTAAPSKSTRVPGSVNIGSIIASNLNTGGPIPTTDTAHVEKSETGFKAATGVAIATDVKPKQSEPRATALPATAPITNYGQMLTPVLQTAVVIEGQTLTAGGATVPWVENGATTQIHLDEKGTPILVLGPKTSTVTQITPAPTVISGQTLSMGGLPVTVDAEVPTTLSLNQAGQTIAVVKGMTSTLSPPPTQVVNFGSGVTATVQVQGNQYLIAGSTLNLGHPVTVSGTVLSLTTNTVGATLLIAGDKTTTLASPPRDVSSTVKDGTTQYIVGSQTLAPGHPITVDGTPMTIMTSGSNTILIVGDKTTTVGGPRATNAGSPGSATGQAEATSKKGGAEQLKRWNARASFVMALSVAVLGLG